MRLGTAHVKGGIGKTTTLVNLATSFANVGLETLLVDVDPQATASYSVGADAKGRSIADVLLYGATAADALQETQVENLQVLAGSPRLAAAEVDLLASGEPLTLLRDALRIGASDFDIVLIDAPSDTSFWALQVVAAADALLVPLSPNTSAGKALEGLLAKLQAQEQRLGGATQLLGVLLTMVEKGLPSAAELRKQHPEWVLETEIPMDVQLAVASGRARPVFAPQACSAAGTAYRRLAGEVLRRARERNLL